MIITETADHDLRVFPAATGFILPLLQGLRLYRQVFHLKFTQKDKNQRIVKFFFLAVRIIVSRSF